MSDRNPTVFFPAAAVKTCVQENAAACPKNRVGVFSRRAVKPCRVRRSQVAALASGNSVRAYEPASGRGFDGNGNVIGLVDMATGTKSATYDYNAFGETIQSDGVASVANHFRFSTKYTDDETGLNYYGYRYYTPSTGRWLSRDPIEEQGGRNICGFVNNNPLSRIDAVGLDAVPLPIGGPDPFPPWLRVLPPVEPTPVPPASALGEAGAVGAAAVVGYVAGTGYDMMLQPIGIDSVGGWWGDQAYQQWDNSQPKYPWVQPPPGYSPKLNNESGKDPFSDPVPANPGADPCKRCLPCPPPVAWRAKGNEHGGTKGFHWHWIEWNQVPSGPSACKCFPKRGAGPKNPNLPNQVELSGIFP